jgi:hypothetical protein
LVPSFLCSLHARCAALNPEVAALPGQAINPAVIDQLLLLQTDQHQQEQQQQQQELALLRTARDDYFTALPSQLGITAAANRTEGDTAAATTPLPQLAAAMLAGSGIPPVAATPVKAKHDQHSLLAAAASAEQQQQQQLQLVLAGCVLQRLQVLQQRLLRVVHWCPAGMSLTAARKKMRAAAAAAGDGSGDGNGPEQDQHQQEQEQQGIEGDTPGDDGDNIQGDEAMDGADDDADAAEFEQQRQRQQQLVQLWRVEASRLVQCLLQPLQQQQQQQHSTVYFNMLASKAALWVEFAAPADLTEIFQIAMTAVVQQQQQLLQPLHQLLGLQTAPNNTAAAAAAAADAHSWLNYAAGRRSCVAAVAGCMQDTLQGLAAAMAAAAAGCDVAGVPDSIPVDAAGSTSSKKKKRHKVKEQQEHTATGAASVAGILGVLQLLQQFKQQLQNQQQPDELNLSTNFSSSSSSIEGLAVAELSSKLLKQHLRPLLKAFKQRHQISGSIHTSSSSSSAEQQQVISQLGVLLRLLQLLSQLPRYGFPQLQGSCLALLALAAVTAVMHVAEAATPPAAAAAAAAAAVGSMGHTAVYSKGAKHAADAIACVGSCVAPAGAGAASDGIEQKHSGFAAAAGCDVHGGLAACVASCVAVGVRCLAQLDALGCGVAAVAVDTALAGAQQQQQQQLADKWHSSMVDVLLLCSKLVAAPNHAAAAAAVDCQVQNVVLQLSGPAIVQLLSSQMVSSQSGGSTTLWAKTANLAVAQLQLCTTAGAAAAAGTLDALAGECQQQVLTAGILGAAAMMSAASGDAAAAAVHADGITAAGVALPELKASCVQLLQKLLLLLAPGQKGTNSSSSSAVAAAAVLCQAMAADELLLQQLAVTGKLAALADAAVQALLEMQQQQQQQQQMLQLLVFVNAAHLALFKAAGSSSNAANDGSSSSSLEYVLERSLRLLQLLQPTCHIAWPELPAAYVSMADVQALGADGAQLTKQLLLLHAQAANLPQQQQQQQQGCQDTSASAAGPVSVPGRRASPLPQQQQQQLLLSGVLIGLRDVVSKASRQQQLLLHQLLCGSSSSLSGINLMHPMAALQPQQQQQQGAAELLPLLQLLLVVLETSSGSKSLKLLAAHAAPYTAALLNIITQAGLLQLPAAAAGSIIGSNMSLLAQQHQQQLAVISWALRCLTSMFGREATFELPAAATAAAMQAVASICQQLAVSTADVAAFAINPAAAAAAAAGAVDAGMAVFCSASGMLVSILRHRSSQLPRLAAHMISAARQALLLLLTWDQGLRSKIAAAQQQQQQQGMSSAQQGPQQQQQQQLSIEVALLLKCAGQLGRLLESLAEQQQHLGRHCHHVITDYVIHMASATSATLTTTTTSSSRAVMRSSSTAAAAAAAAVAGTCSVEVAAAVRGGACVLFGVLGPGEVQGVHVVVGQGPLGSVRRGALAALKTEYEARYKHSGKV